MSTIFNRRFATNYLSTLAFIGLSYWVISSLSDFHRSMLQGQWQLGMFDIDAVITVQALFIALMALYAVILVPYYATYPWMHSKSFAFVQGLWFALRRSRKRDPVSDGSRTSMSLPLNLRLSPLSRQAGLALLLKFFFAPLMINWCLVHIANLSVSMQQFIAGIENGLEGRVLFDTSLFWAAFQLILFIDTLLFTLGYVIELPVLGNRIRTVDPTFFGWFICLACYPPFNDFTGRFLEWRSSDFPGFDNDYLHYRRQRGVAVRARNLLLGFHRAWFQGQQSDESRHRDAVALTRSSGTRPMWRKTLRGGWAPCPPSE